MKERGVPALSLACVLGPYLSRDAAPQGKFVLGKQVKQEDMSILLQNAKKGHKTINAIQATLIVV